MWIRCNACARAFEVAPLDEWEYDGQLASCSYCGRKHTKEMCAESVTTQYEQNDSVKITAAAALLGRKGGSSTSAAKKTAARANGAKNPSLRERALRRVQNSPDLAQYEAEIMADWPEGNEHWRWVLTESIPELMDWAETVRRGG